MQPFLLITTRGADEVAAGEYASYCTLPGLEGDDLEWRRADQAPLGKLDLASYSGVILAGSPFTVSEPAGKEAVVALRDEREAAEPRDAGVGRDERGVGRCYGIGTIGAHQGASVNNVYGETSQAVRISLTEDGLVDPLFRELPPEFEAFVGHKEAISDVPAHIAVLASSPSCPVQAFRVGENVYATQFHPELDQAAMAARVEAYSQHGYFAPETIGEILHGVATADVRASHLVLGRFVEQFARATPRTLTA